jgi:hypothetical protein
MRAFGFCAIARSQLDGIAAMPTLAARRRHR